MPDTDRKQDEYELTLREINIMARLAKEWSAPSNSCIRAILAALASGQLPDALGYAGWLRDQILCMKTACDAIAEVSASPGFAALRERLAEVLVAPA